MSTDAKDGRVDGDEVFAVNLDNKLENSFDCNHLVISVIRNRPRLAPILFSVDTVSYLHLTRYHLFFYSFVAVYINVWWSYIRLKCMRFSISVLKATYYMVLNKDQLSTRIMAR